jgi:hypothetical protein
MIPKVIAVIFEALKAVKMTLLSFWVLTPCGLAGRYQHFGEILVSTYESIQHNNSKEQHRPFSCLIKHYTMKAYMTVEAWRLSSMHP